MEKSFVNALNTLKRNTVKMKYSPVDRVLDVIYGYYLRKEDEVPALVTKYNKWCETKGYKYDKVDLEIVLSCL